MLISILLSSKNEPFYLRIPSEMKICLLRIKIDKGLRFYVSVDSVVPIATIVPIIITSLPTTTPPLPP